MNDLNKIINALFSMENDNNDCKLWQKYFLVTFLAGNEMNKFIMSFVGIFNIFRAHWCQIIHNFQKLNELT